MQGVLLHASPPVKHESPMSYQGYEVTKYQPPWKTFSDFAIHSESDDCMTATPAFQHLVNQVRKTQSRVEKLSLTFTFHQLHGYDLPDEAIGTNYTEIDWQKNRDSTDSYQESEESAAGSL